MLPLTVQMAKAVADQLGPEEVEEYRNIVSKSYVGWSNIYQGYFLGPTGSAPADTLGRPVMFSHYIHSWLDSQPL